MGGGYCGVVYKYCVYIYLSPSEITSVSKLKNNKNDVVSVHIVDPKTLRVLHVPPDRREYFSFFLLFFLFLFCFFSFN